MTDWTPLIMFAALIGLAAALWLLCYHLRSRGYHRTIAVLLRCADAGQRVIGVLQGVVIAALAHRAGIKRR